LDIDASLDSVFSSLGDIEHMIFNKGRVIDETLGLPIAAERARQLVARQEEAAAREVSRIAAMHEARAERVQRLQDAAKQQLGDEAETWLNAASGELKGKVPLDNAQLGSSELSHALDALGRESSRRREEKRKQRELADLGAKLEIKIMNILGELTQAFLVSPYPELDGKRPRDFCTNSETMKKCVELAEKVRRKRR
jgi:hypothetical protein